MSNFFNMDNTLFSTLSKIFDIIFISVIWIIFCIPIITFGPASTALYYVTVKVIRRERGYLMREFFKSFRMNFKRGAVVGGILTILFAILLYDLLYAWEMVNLDYSKGSILLGVFIALSFLTLSFSIYVFPILSRFDMTIKQLFKAGVFMSMRHILYTFLMTIVVIASIVVTLFIPILVFVVPGASILLNSLMMERIFKKYMPESSGPGEETGKDEWYLGE